MTASVGREVQVNRLSSAALQGAEDAGGKDFCDLGKAVGGAGRKALCQRAMLRQRNLRHAQYIPRHFAKCRVQLMSDLQSGVVFLAVWYHKAGNRISETLRKLIAMPRFHLPRLSKPGVLEKIKPDRLTRLLAPMSSYLEDSDFSWPVDGQPADYKLLGALLRFPKDGVPADMILPLVLIDEMSTDAQMDKLLGEAKRQKINLNLLGENSPADVAVEVWLQAPNLLQDCHAENFTIRQRKFFHFAGTGDHRLKPKNINEEQLRALEHDLDDTFVKWQRGRGCRVFVVDRGRKAWITIRRGGSFRREESMKKGGQAGMQAFRPMEYDVLVYDIDTDDLGLHVQTKWQTELYLKCVGEHMFGDGKYFQKKREIMFDPIVKDGAKALLCDDIPGISKIRLVEAQKFWPNDQNEVDIKKADDILALGERAAKFLSSGRLAVLVFEFDFEDSKKPRRVSLRLKNVTKYERDDDGDLVDVWLCRRGFILRSDPVRDVTA